MRYFQIMINTKEILTHGNEIKSDGGGRRIDRRPLMRRVKWDKIEKVDRDLMASI